MATRTGTAIVGRRHGSGPASVATLGLLVLLMLGSGCPKDEPTRSTSRPNIILFVADDLGWTDAAVFGSDYYETPAIDRLVSEGMWFTHAYATANCSPSRASLLTGRWPVRFGITDRLTGPHPPSGRLQTPDIPAGLPLEEWTLAELLKSGGYVTGLVGKWHLGGNEYMPQHQGFDFVFGAHARGHHGSMFAPYDVLSEAIPDAVPGEYLTERLTSEALQFIEANRAGPFFLMLSHYAVHGPPQARPADIRYFENKQPSSRQGNAEYAAMLRALDASLDAVVDRLRSLGIDDRTVVIFVSDNGGSTSLTSNAPLRGGKGGLFEGGIRIPAVVRWPGVIPGGATCNTPITITDLYPTLAELVGIDPPRDRPLDGLSLLPLLRGTGTLPKRDLYWHEPHYSLQGDPPSGAILRWPYKLIEFFDNERLLLFDLDRDQGESKDLSAEQPQRATELQRALQEWRRAVAAKMPRAGPLSRSPVDEAPRGVDR